MKQRVLTIHGIKSKGEWQDAVAECLEPWFDCRALRYSGYLDDGWIKVGIRVVVDPGHRRRNETVEAIRVQYDGATRDSAEPPALIAHSFGTVVAAELLEKYPWVQFDRIILVGCVLPAFYDWDKVLDTDPNKFLEIRNETGGKDWIVGLAGVASTVQHGLGLSGLVGFLRGNIHGLGGPLQKCKPCQETGSGGPPARVHNAPLEKYGHSTAFLSERHFTDLWLPFLWGYAPCDYLEFLKLCERVKRLESEGSAVDEDEARERFHEWIWPWNQGGIPFYHHIGIALTAEIVRQSKSVPGTGLDRPIRLAVDGVCEAVVAALPERGKPRVTRNLHRVAALYPRIAVTRAVKKVVALM